jgi:hypothetical protein
LFGVGFFGWEGNEGIIIAVVIITIIINTTIKTT